MADDLQFSSNKRKFDDQGSALPPPPRRSTGFSAPIVSPPSETTAVAASAYNSVPPPLDHFQLAKQKAQEIAARIFSNAEAKRAKAEDGYDSGNAVAADYSQKSLGQPHVGMTPPSTFPAYGYQGPNKKIEIPNGRVGVIIGKGGETIKYLQAQSGAKIQVTRDMDADPNSQTRLVEIVGNSEQIGIAEKLITEVLAEAEAGGSGVSARKVGNVPYGAEQFVMKVPNNKVGLIIGKGGEAIKSMQAKSGARIQIIPLHLPPGDISQERTVQIDGTNEQIEAAKQLISEVTSSERMRPSMGGGYSQQGYRPPQPPSWGPPGAPQMQQQQPGYGYMQPGAYPAQPPQYNMPPQSYGAYPSPYPDQSSNQQAQQTSTTPAGYDYYGQQQQQQPQQQPVGGSGAPADGNTYNYSQPPPSYGSQVPSYSDPAYSQAAGGQQQQQGYGQDSYAAGYQAQGYGQPAYDQQGYGSTPAYPPQDGSAPAYGNEGGSSQVPASQQAPPPAQASAAQQGYNSNQVPASAAGYGNQAPASGYMQSAPVTPPSYGQPPQAQNTAPNSQAGYAYGQAPPAHQGYAQAPQSTDFGSGGTQPSYGQQQSYASVPPQGQAAYGAAYSHPPAYSSENANHGAYDAPSALPAVPTGAAKASPKS